MWSVAYVSCQSASGSTGHPASARAVIVYRSDRVPQSSPQRTVSAFLSYFLWDPHINGGIAAMQLKIVVFYGSVRSNRKGIRAARFIVDGCRDCGHEVSLIDPVEYPLPLLDKMYKEYEPEQAPEVLQRMARLIIPADAYIVVSGEYNHTIPPALANLLDHFLEEYFWKPSAIVCYSAGPFGGVRAAMTLRCMLAELGMSSIPSLLPIPKVQTALDHDGTPLDETLPERARKFLSELEWYARALKAAREQPSERSYCDGRDNEIPHPLV
jgi:NAD(P)H-dependent FMN reductase